MFSFFKKKPPLLRFKNIRAFGKLPGFADFVRYRSADPEAVKIDTWLTQGLSSLIQQGKQIALESDWEIGFCRPQEKQYTLICIASSQDKSKRHYPFVVMAQIENAWFKHYPLSLTFVIETLSVFLKSLQQPEMNQQQNLIDQILDFENRSIAYGPVTSFDYQCLKAEHESLMPFQQLFKSQNGEDLENPQLVSLSETFYYWRHHENPFQ